jgi:hypothetical protein
MKWTEMIARKVRACVKEDAEAADAIAIIV